MIQVDTHVLVWLHGGELDRLPAAAKQRLEAGPVSVSPMVELELAVLHEIGRVTAPPQQILGAVGLAIGLEIATAPFAAVARAAVGLAWTRDPFDRLIAAQAIVDDALLLTADEHMRANLERAAWA